MIFLHRFLSMDPVQNDLNLLGIKQANGDGYNIHIPPLPKDGKHLTSIIRGGVIAIFAAYYCWSE